MKKAGSMMQHFELDGRSCWLYPVGKPETPGDTLVLAFPCDSDTTGTLPDILRRVEEAAGEAPLRPFVLAGFESQNWEQDFTPWQAPRLFKRAEDFSGGAPQTLAWMEDAFLPAVLEKGGLGGDVEYGILGYSLGGLFALWSFYESGRFGCCASCSGSLWYEGWDEYMAGHEPPQGSRIYLSLGKNEEHAKNQRMARVGDVTRRAAGLYGQSPGVAEVYLQWQEGGHFDDVPGRIAQALLWLAKR